MLRTGYSDCILRMTCLEGGGCGVTIGVVGFATPATEPFKSGVEIVCWKRVRSFLLAEGPSLLSVWMLASKTVGASATA